MVHRNTCLDVTVDNPQKSSSSSLGSHSVVGRRPRHAVSKLACLVLSPADRVPPIFVQVVSPPLGWSTLSYILVVLYPSGDHRGPSIVFETVDVLCYPGPLHSRLCPTFVLSLT